MLIRAVATATECAAYGVLGSLAIAWWSGSLTWQNFRDSLMGATRVSCMIMFILAGASFLSSPWASPASRARSPSGWPRWSLYLYALIAALAVFYMVLGMALDGISMIVLTDRDRAADDPEGGLRPRLVRHLHRAAGGDREVTPPVGFNLFVLQNMTGGTSNYIARAAMPFFAMLVVTSRSSRCSRRW